MDEPRRVIRVKFQWVKLYETEHNISIPAEWTDEQVRDNLRGMYEEFVVPDLYGYHEENTGYTMIEWRHEVICAPDPDPCPDLYSWRIYPAEAKSPRGYGGGGHDAEE